MDPLLTYKGRWLEGSYTFELFPNTLHVFGSTFLRYEEDATIDLATLQRRVDRYRVRSGVFTAGLLILVASTLAFTVAVSALRLDPFGFLTGLTGAIGATGLVMVLAAVRKTEIARFVTDAGVAAVGIPRTRPGDGFDEFIDQMLVQIRKNKPSSEPSSVDMRRDTTAIQEL